MLSFLRLHDPPKPRFKSCRSNRGYWIITQAEAFTRRPVLHESACRVCSIIVLFLYVLYLLYTARVFVGVIALCGGIYCTVFLLSNCFLCFRFSLSFFFFQNFYDFQVYSYRNKAKCYTCGIKIVQAILYQVHFQQSTKKRSNRYRPRSCGEVGKVGDGGMQKYCKSLPEIIIYR